MTDRHQNSHVTTVGASGRLTIPKEIRERVNLHEGDRVMLSVSGSTIEVVPATVVPRDQAWFYAPEIQDRIAEAERDVSDGRVTGARNEEQVLRHLERLRDES